MSKATSETTAEKTNAPTESPSTQPKITDDLRSFYAQHGVDVDRLQSGEANQYFASRFIRLNPRMDTQETLAKLKEELEKGDSSSTPEPLPVPWLDEKMGFYALPGDFPLSQSPCYKAGRIYGMDVSSGAAVAALLSNTHDKDKTTTSPTDTPQRVLDLCCAPGLKLCALADYLEANDSVVVGVDVSEHRIATTKRILHKYRMQEQSTKESARIRLYCGDGTTFDQHNDDKLLPNLVFDSQAAQEESAVNGKRKRMNKSARARERKRLKSMTTVDFYQEEDSWKAHAFDRVLVDAECSTDGSLKHIQKQLQGTAETVAPLLTDAKKLADLVELQKKLAAAGFRMLKPGGCMVYSTCSLSQDQNENVVQWLLKEFPDAAFRIPLDFSSALKTDGSASNPKIKEGEWGVRFEPNFPTKPQQSTDGKRVDSQQMFFGGGFFLAKIGKRAQAADT